MFASTLPDTSIARRFKDYHQDNPRVFDMFRRFALEAIESGRERLGARVIWERMRWFSMIETDDEFKLNDHYIAYYARMFVYFYPEHRGFFTFRTLKV